MSSPYHVTSSTNGKKIESFEDLVVWQKSRNLAKIIYDISNPWKDFGLKDQVRRSAVSIVSNIAEGFERGSKKELIQFFYIAKGSAGELRAQLIISHDLKYISQQTYIDLSDKANHIGRMLAKFIKKYREHGYGQNQKK